jgi:hypothetical protein
MENEDKAIIPAHEIDCGSVRPARHIGAKRPSQADAAIAAEVSRVSRRQARAPDDVTSK